MIVSCKGICPSKETALFSISGAIGGAIGGAISGRFFGISPLHGAVFGTVSSITYQVAMRISCLICEKFHGKVHRNKDTSNIPVNLTKFACAVCSNYLGYLVGSKTLSLLGRQAPFGTVVGLIIASGVIEALGIGLIFGDQEAPKRQSL